MSVSATDLEPRVEMLERILVDAGNTLTALRKTVHEQNSMIMELRGRIKMLEREIERMHEAAHAKAGTYV